MWINEILFSARARSFLLEFLSFSRFRFFAEFTSLKHFAFRRISRAWSHHWKAGEGHGISLTRWYKFLLISQSHGVFFWTLLKRHSITACAVDPLRGDASCLPEFWWFYGSRTPTSSEHYSLFCRRRCDDRQRRSLEWGNKLDGNLTSGCTMWFDVIRCDSVWLNSPRTIVSCRSN